MYHKRRENADLKQNEAKCQKLNNSPHNTTGHNIFNSLFSAMLTSARFSLKTWPQEESWPGLELFLMLLRRQRIRMRLERFLVLMWLRRASTTSPGARLLQLMQDAIQLLTSREVSLLTPVTGTWSTPVAQRPLEITCASRSGDGWGMTPASRLKESRTWSCHSTTVLAMVTGPQWLTMELISMLMNLCAVTLMEPSSGVMEQILTSSADMQEIHIHWLFKSNFAIYL